jgi:hypothetical protein
MLAEMFQEGHRAPRDALLRPLYGREMTTADAYFYRTNANSRIAVTPKVYPVNSSPNQGKGFELLSHRNVVPELLYSACPASRQQGVTNLHRRKS